jgi:hypothetical protein
LIVLPDLVLSFSLSNFTGTSQFSSQGNLQYSTLIPFSNKLQSHFTSKVTAPSFILGPGTGNLPLKTNWGRAKPEPEERRKKQAKKISL